jgi:lipoate-protein ligase A
LVLAHPAPEAPPAGPPPGRPCGRGAGGHNPGMLRLLPLLTADGPTHMATDEALLEAAAVPTLRLYRWQPATVSLGYFQDYQAVLGALPRPGGQAPPVVRRITGGGAIWHQHEVTYCLVARLGAGGLPARVRDLYPLLHGALLAGLRARGARLERQVAPQGDRRYQSEPRCFAAPASDDLMTAGGAKVLGSAARARGERVLVHGSLKLESNPWDGDLAGGCGLDFATAAAVIETALAGALGTALVAGELEAAEQAARARILGLRYGDDGWVSARRGPRP